GVPPSRRPPPEPVVQAVLERRDPGQAPAEEEHAVARPHRRPGEAVGLDATRQVLRTLPGDSPAVVAGHDVLVAEDAAPIRGEVRPDPRPLGERRGRALALLL